MDPVKSDAPIFVLVHSPLVGPLTWTRVADELRRRGRGVVLAHLDCDAAVDVPLWKHQAEQTRRAVEAHTRTDPVVVVGHSGAGQLLPAIGETLVNDVVGYVFVDSELPRDQMRRLDTAPSEFAQKLSELADGGYLPPWEEWWESAVLETLLPDEQLRERFAAELRPVPVALFTETLRVPHSWPDAPCGYLRLSKAYDQFADAAGRRGWDVIGFDAGHLHMLVDPPAVAAALEELADGLPDRPDPDDPVLAARRRVSSMVDLGRRVGFLALAVAIFLFAVALYWGLPSILVQLIVASLVIAALTLLPSLVFGLGVSAAEREDHERGHG